MFPSKLHSTRLLVVTYLTIILLPVHPLEAQQIVNSSGNTVIDGTGASNGVAFSGSASGMVLDVSNTVNVNANKNTVGIDTTGITAGGSASVLFNGSSNVYGNVGTVDNPLTSITGGVANGQVLFLGRVHADTLLFGGDGMIAFINGANLFGPTLNITGVNNQGSLYFLNEGRIDGDIGDNGPTGSLKAVYFNTGVTTVGYNIFANSTTINNGTLIFTNANHIVSHDLFLSNNATVDVGVGTVNVGNNYSQLTGTALDVTANYYNSTTGRILAAGTATVDSGSAVHVTVGGYIPNGAAFNIISSTGTAVDTPGTITDNSSFVNFTPSNDSSNLYLTADRASTGFQSSAVTDNQKNMGWALDNVTNGNADMVSQLNALETLSRSEINADLGTLMPEIDGGLQRTAFAAFDDFAGLAVDRLSSLRWQKANPPSGNGLWVQGYGSFLDQGARGESGGYNSEIFGTAVGFDRALSEHIRLGASFGYANGSIHSHDNNNHTDSDSYQIALYGDYHKNNTYLAGAVLYGWNNYTNSRNPIVGGTSRLALGQFSGSQYGTYWELGHVIKKQGWEITPLASFEYQHLGVDGYSETGADALDLQINSQGYNLVESGVGAKISRQFHTSCGTWIPEIHAKWLYDFADDGQNITASFTGGGSAFQVSGPKPGRSTGDFGLSLTLATKANMELSASYDLLCSDGYAGQTGLLSLRYRF